MKRLMKVVPVVGLLATTMLISSPSASADGNNCGFRTVQNVETKRGYGFQGFDVKSTSSWENCDGHSHAKQFGISIIFNDNGKVDDWRNDSDDYISYSCVAKTDTRVLDEWSGRLTEGNRSDGRNIANQSVVRYKVDPRIVCEAVVHEDLLQDGELRFVGRPR